MKIRMVCGFVLLCIVVSVLIGCGSEKEVITQAGKRENPEKEEAVLVSVSDGGAWNQDYAIMNGGGIVCYYVKATHEYLPLCAKADCSHRLGDESCMAVLLAKESGGMVAKYGDHLWFTNSDQDGVVHLYKTSLWGDNLETVSELLSGYFSATTRMLLWKDKMIRVVKSFVLDENQNVSGFEYCLTEVDLTTGKEAVLEGPVTLEGSGIQLLGIYGNRYYFFFRLSEAPTNEFPYGTLYARDIDTEEVVSCKAHTNKVSKAGICENALYTMIQEDGSLEIWECNLDTGEERIVVKGEDIEGQNAKLFIMENHLLIYTEVSGETGNGRWWRFSPETASLEVVAENRDLTFTPIKQLEDGYFGVYSEIYPENGGRILNEYAYIGEEGFKRGERPVIITENSYKPILPTGSQ